MNFHHDAIRTCGDSGARQWPDKMALPGRMGSIDHNRKMRDAPHSRNRSQIERVACVLREGANASLTKHDVVVSFSHDVLSRQQPLIKSCSQSALEQDGKR